MEFEGEIFIRTPRKELWQVISDPQILVSAVPGAKEVEQLSETKYRGIIERSVGGISISMEGEMELTDRNPYETLSAVVTGNDELTNSRMEATADMTLVNDNDGTLQQYHIDLSFSGRIASLGARILRRQIKSDIDTFFDNLKEKVEKSNDYDT